jgi:hypothetical protein
MWYRVFHTKNYVLYLEPEVFYLLSQAPWVTLFWTKFIRHRQAVLFLISTLWNSTLKTEATCFSETSILAINITCHHNPEDHTINTYRRFVFESILMLSFHPLFLSLSLSLSLWLNTRTEMFSVFIVLPCVLCIRSIFTPACCVSHCTVLSLMNILSSVHFMSQDWRQELSQISRQVPFPGSSLRQRTQSSCGI